MSSPVTEQVRCRQVVLCHDKSESKEIINEKTRYSYSSYNGAGCKSIVEYYIIQR